MSHIPNSAIPHATADQPADQQQSAFGFDRLTETVREHPKATAAAAAGVVAAGIAAAAAIRGRRSKDRD